MNGLHKRLDRLEHNLWGGASDFIDVRLLSDDELAHLIRDAGGPGDQGAPRLADYSDEELEAIVAWPITVTRR